MPGTLILPDAGTRMTPGRKALIVEAIRRGILTHARACELYDLSIEELNTWLDRDRSHGTRGHAIRHLQEVRRHG